MTNTKEQRDARFSDLISGLVPRSRKTLLLYSRLFDLMDKIDEINDSLNAIKKSENGEMFFASGLASSIQEMKKDIRFIEITADELFNIPRYLEANE